METINPSADQAADLVHKLSLETQSKSLNVPEVTKKSNGSVATGNAPSSERSTTPILQDYVDPSMYYLSNGYASQPYYFGTYNNKWEDYSRYVNPDEGVYGDYYPGYGYAPYGAYAPGSPVPTGGADGQLYSHQQYQYPGIYYMPPSPASSHSTTTSQTTTPQVEVSASANGDDTPIPSDPPKISTKGTSNGHVNGDAASAPLKHGHLKPITASSGPCGNGALPSGIPSVYSPDPRYPYDGMRSPIPWLDGSAFLDGQQRQVPTGTLSSVGLNSQRPGSGSHGLMSRMYPNNRIYGQFGGAYRGGFGSTGFDSRVSGWYPIDPKYKTRGRMGIFSNENNDLGELNRGPRSGPTKIQKASSPNPAIPVKGQNVLTSETNEGSTLVPEKELYNKVDFLDTYVEAKFFVIKSYSEDDVHKSIKYGVWASTVNGNKKLHSAYMESKEKASGCPVFLFFSVNTSGQFVGVAEMVGPVDFNKTVDYWQQDRWNGCFPVTWHIVKDLPNSLLKHIILENNDNKPVTNSRDTQEVKLEQGLQMLKLFKEHVHKTSILDDFLFYEVRQKTMQERRAKQQQFLKQVSARSNSIEEKDREGTGEREPSDGADTEDSKSTEEDTLKVNTALVNDTAQNAAKLAANVVHNSC